MEQYDFWEKKGLDLGLSSKPLLEFIASKIAMEDKRLREQHERDQRAIDREDRNKREEMQHEKEMKEKELELARLQQGLPRSDLSDDLLKMPKLPPFRDGDDITSYFIRFERMADMCKWPKATWATRVGLLFQGHAMKIYSSLPPAITKDYVQLKSAILRAYRRTPDQYRQDFRQAKISDHENYTQFLVTLSRLFDYWYDSLDYDRTFEDMRKLVIGDQFLSTMPTDIRMFIKERKTLDPEEMGRLADDFATAHKCYPKHSQKGSKGSSNKA